MVALCAVSDIEKLIHDWKMSRFITFQ